MYSFIRGDIMVIENDDLIMVPNLENEYDEVEYMFKLANRRLNKKIRNRLPERRDMSAQMALMKRQRDARRKKK